MEESQGEKNDSGARCWNPRHRCAGLFDPLVQEKDEVGEDTQEAGAKVKIVEENFKKEEIR